MTSNLLQAIRARYGFRKHTVANEDEWNELARLFVQRFQELSQIPNDSLAGPMTFALNGAAGTEATTLSVETVRIRSSSTVRARRRALRSALLERGMGMKITEHEMLITIASMALRMDDLTGADVLDTFKQLGFEDVVSEARKIDSQGATPAGEE